MHAPISFPKSLIHDFLHFFIGGVLVPVVEHLEPRIRYIWVVTLHVSKSLLALGKLNGGVVERFSG